MSGDSTAAITLLHSGTTGLVCFLETGDALRHHCSTVRKRHGKTDRGARQEIQAIARANVRYAGPMGDMRGQTGKAISHLKMVDISSNQAVKIQACFTDQPPEVSYRLENSFG